MNLPLVFVKLRFLRTLSGQYGQTLIVTEADEFLSRVRLRIVQSPRRFCNSTRLISRAEQSFSGIQYLSSLCPGYVTQLCAR